MINSELIFNYIKNLENEILKLKEQILMKDNVINTNISEIENLSKVSIITNLNKQIKEKNINIEILERTNENLLKLNRELESDNKLNNSYKNIIKELENENSKKNKDIEYLENKLKVCENRIFCLEEEISSSNLLKLKEENDKLIEKIKSLENEEEYETIIYKNIEYIIDDEQNVYTIKDNKPDKIVGKLKNNKVKLNK
jgi:hypothetical protein